MQNIYLQTDAMEFRASEKVQALKTTEGNVRVRDDLSNLDKKTWLCQILLEDKGRNKFSFR